MDDLKYYDKICSDIRDFTLDILIANFPSKAQEELDIELYQIFKNCELKQANVLKLAYGLEIEEE